MERVESRSVGIFERTIHVSALARPLLTTVGYTVSLYSDAAQSLEVFLQRLIEHQKRVRSPLYDLLILAPSSQELTDKACHLLEQWTASHVAPLLLLTERPVPAQEPLLFTVSVTPFLSRRIFFVQAFVEALERAIGVAFPFTGPLANTMLQWQRAQFQEAIQLHQSWIDQRHEWLKQRIAWMNERRAWLHGRARWLEEQRQQPGAQYAWLDEQQIWVEAQQEEVNQQERILMDQQRWITHQQQKLDQVMQPFFKWA
ncbi:MAG TPA: hypothetical protein VFV38_24050 [Ktedonobacteraceae bacterium]|nr:hypothetical protein [Ktedonobacteraceae bacterium]